MFRGIPFSPFWWFDPNNWRDYEETFPERSLISGPIQRTLEGTTPGPRGGELLKSWTHNQAGVVTKERTVNGDLLIKAQLPGVNREDVRLDLNTDDKESTLTLSVTKKEEVNKQDRNGGYFECKSHFNVVRTIPLGAKISFDDVKADLADENLIIEVKMPKQTGADRSSRIDIHAARRSNTPQKQKQGKQEDVTVTDEEQQS